jgi:hypothetical protein
MGQGTVRSKLNHLNSGCLPVSSPLNPGQTRLAKAVSGDVQIGLLKSANRPSGVVLRFAWTILLRSEWTECR